MKLGRGAGRAEQGRPRVGVSGGAAGPEIRCGARRAGYLPGGDSGLQGASRSQEKTPSVRAVLQSFPFQIPTLGTGCVRESVGAYPPAASPLLQEMFQFIRRLVTRTLRCACGALQTPGWGGETSGPRGRG